LKVGAESSLALSSRADLADSDDRVVKAGFAFNGALSTHLVFLFCLEEGERSAVEGFSSEVSVASAAPCLAEDGNVSGDPVER
jgi:hypothetical protein